MEYTSKRKLYNIKLNIRSYTNTASLLCLESIIIKRNRIGHMLAWHILIY